jgi:PAS domain S-box-containing protein
VQEVTRNLQISDQKYKDLIEFSPDMIHLISLSGEVRLSNKIALRSLGRNGDGAEAVRLHDLVIPGQAGQVDAFLETVSKESIFKGEFTFKTHDGNNLHVEMVATIAKWGMDDENLVCCFSRNLTERKRLEENLLYSERLAVMGQMTAGIAHEINNPLGIILTNAEEILNHSLDADELRESLQSIERNALRAGKIIEDLLSFTRPSPLDKTSIDMTQLIDESLFFLKHRLKKKSIQVNKSYDADPAVFHGDEKLIQQLFINLILNAIQAVGNEGKITLKTKLTGNDEKRAIHFEVEDNGIGIRQKDRGRIFDPFFTVRKEGGFGLGLFISKIIIDKHNGSILVDSKPGEGTTMAIGFPVGEKADTTEDNNTAGGILS